MMDISLADIIEVLFWFAIFVIWLISQIWKALRGKGKKEAELQKKEKDEKLTPARVMFGLLKRGFRNFSDEVSRMQAGEPKEPFPERELFMQAPLPTHHRDSIIEESMPEDALVEIAETKPKPRPETHDVSQPTRISLDLSGQGMRRAVILSEILGRPVALRDKF